MKRILFALTMFGLFLSAARQMEAAEVSFDFFYNNLNDGNWIEVADYGYCWQPTVAVSDTSWRPYADGYWAYTDVGWTWVSNEDFGWATYHYGRWARLADTGWIWIPGTEWGPAWVSWRTGGDQVGWAPLPPARVGARIYEGRAITGQVDIEFDIGPAYYNFVDVRFIGEPRLRERIYEPSRNVTFISNTVNVTNITYNNSIVYNYGPDYNQLSQYSTRPIQRLTIERQTNVAAGAAIQPGAAMKVESGKLVVAAPMTVKKAPPTVTPKNVKAKIAQAKLETGWSGISDPSAKAQLQQKMKTEDATKIPPSNLQPSRGAADVKTQAAPAATAAAGAPPAATAAPAASAAPAGISPAASPAPATSPREKGRGRAGQKIEPTATAGETQPPPSKRPGAKREKTEMSPAASVPPRGEEATGEPPRSVEEGKGKRAKARTEEPGAPSDVSRAGEEGKAKPGRQLPPEAAGEPAGPKKGRGPAERATPSTGKAPREAAPGRGEQEKQPGGQKKKKGGAESPSPSPGT